MVAGDRLGLGVQKGNTMFPYRCLGSDIEDSARLVRREALELRRE